MASDLVLLMVLALGGMAMACLWVLIWGDPTPPRLSGTASSGAANRSPSSGLARIGPILDAVEVRLGPWSGTRWAQALLARDGAMIVRSGLQGQVHAGRIHALRVSLLIGALGLALAIILIASVADSLMIHGHQAPPSGVVHGIGALVVLLGLWWPEHWLRTQRTVRERALLKDLPYVLDLLTLSVESGASLASALGHAATKGPQGPLREEIQRTLQEVRSGIARVDALRAMASRVDLPSVSNWVAAMISAQQQGSSLGPVLRAQADQRREERFLRAEKAAMKAPVKMLFPLLVFIFPCTFLLLFFPVAVRLVQEGLLR